MGAHWWVKRQLSLHRAFSYVLLVLIPDCICRRDDFMVHVHVKRVWIRPLLLQYCWLLGIDHFLCAPLGLCTRSTHLSQHSNIPGFLDTLPLHDLSLHVDLHKSDSLFLHRWFRTVHRCVRWKHLLLRCPRGPPSLLSFFIWGRSCPQIRHRRTRKSLRHPVPWCQSGTSLSLR